MNPTDLDADALSRALHARELSCRALMQATLDRIAALNPRFNALVSLCPDEDRLLAAADERDAELARGASRGWLHGIPLAIKDAAHATGFPTTLGNRLLARAEPADDSLMTARMKAAGGLVIGKTNVPEFGLGSHTFNDLFGVTRNAWDPAVSAGGSSGGAAVALALRLLAVADGSDFMGSLRNPAAWNHVFGLRPSFGRVPKRGGDEVWLDQLATEGPMARTVADLARLLDLQAGHHPHAPLSIAEPPGKRFVPAPQAVEGALRGLRIGWLGDLDGHLAVEDGLLACHEAALARMASAGAIVEPLAFGFDAEALWQAWLVWRMALVAPRVAAVLALRPDARDFVKPEALWEHDRAQSLSYLDFHAASQVRSRWHAHLLDHLFARHDLLALPATQAWPFPVEQRWPQAIAGRAMDTYHRWMEVTVYATFAGAPAISVPAGFHANGRWPCGLQLVARPGHDAALLLAAAGYEAISHELLARRPPAAQAA